MPIRVLIVGAGSIGAFFGSRLATVPNTLVSALCRSNYKAVSANGFRVSSPKYGDQLFKPEFTFANPNEARKSSREKGLKWDFLVMATKALPDVSDDSKLLEELVGDETSIVLMQNGLGIEEPYRQRFPSATILSAVTMASTAQPEHGLVKHNRWTKISVGPYLPHLDASGSGPNNVDAVASESNARFVSLLKEGGIADAETYDHAGMQFARWHKVAVNAAINPSAVLSGGCGNQEMSLDADLREHLAGVMNEVLTTAPIVLGKPLPKGLATPEQILRSTARNTSGSRPSMWQDWEKGQRMEVEVILGNPIRIAREMGVEMPRLQSMYALLKMAQDKRNAAVKESRL